jgi:hypothetical protein
MNKREFVLAGGSALLAGSPGFAAATALVAAPPLPGQATQATWPSNWQQRLGERFAVFGAAAPMALVLREVRANDSDAALQQFTLLFARRGAALGSGTQVLRQADGSALPLYLDECGTSADGQPLVRAHFCQLR